MTTLITTVGDTDPIRDYRDGAILHICRKYQPEHLVIIHSERTRANQEKLERAVRSVYQGEAPEFSYPLTIPNDQVYQFDLMFATISELVRESLNHLPKDEKVLLNLSSGTPQMKSALFTYFQINDLNLRAIQVKSPSLKGSNQDVEHQNQEDIEVLIALNEDNRPDYEDRSREEVGLNFTASLNKRTIRNLLENYDYIAALQVLKDMTDFPRRKELLKSLEEVKETFDLLKVPSKLAKLPLSEEGKIALNFFLMIEVQYKRGNVADCLVKLKTLVEYLYRDFIDRHYPSFLDHYDKVDEEGSYYLTIKDFEKILKDKQEWRFFNQFREIRSLNSSRNHYAHKVTELDGAAKNEAGKAIRLLKKVLKEEYKINPEWFYYYERFNVSCIEKLKE